MKKIALILFVICMGCTSTTNKAIIKIAVADNGRAIKITGLDYAIMQEINRDTSTAAWQSLVPVYRMPADTDMKDYQPVQPGKYQVKDSAIIFMPDTPFLKQQTYFVRFYQYAEGNSKWDYIKQRKKLGNPIHTDLIFKQ